MPNNQLILRDAPVIEINNRSLDIIHNTDQIYYITDNTSRFIVNTNITSTSTNNIFYLSNNFTVPTSTTMPITSSNNFIYYSTSTSPCLYMYPGLVTKPIPRKPIKTIRSSIKKALKLISNFGMDEDIRIFLGGDNVEVSHPDSMFKFVIKKKYNNLIRATEFPSYSTPYELKLFTKTDIHIADLCVYVKDTPLLDQVLSLAFFIKSGNEDEILKKANYFSKNKNNLFLESIVQDVPYLESKLK